MCAYAYRLAGFSILFMAFGVLSACATVPGTGRSQLSLVDERRLSAIAAQQYAQIKSQMTLSTNRGDRALVNRVGANIARAAETLLHEQGQAEQIANFRWEFSLFENSQVNAFAAPGGKVGIFTGILPYARDEAGLAVIIGHEVAHIIARHAQERASQQMLAELGGQALGAGLSLGKATPATMRMAAAAYGFGSLFGVILPYSRVHEYEADRLGMTLMAMAGYDPTASLDMWRRMIEGGQGSEGFEFTRTHPVSRNRLAEMEKRLPEARARYAGRSARPMAAKWQPEVLAGQAGRAVQPGARDTIREHIENAARRGDKRAQADLRRLQAAADSGDEVAKFMLEARVMGDSLEREEDERLRKAAETVDSKAKTESELQALAMYRKAAEQGDRTAQYQVGIFYFNGIGVEKDYRKAAEWSQKAADQGLGSAYLLLAGIYYSGGYGVAKDPAKSCHNLRQAAKVDPGAAEALEKAPACAQ